MKSSFTQAGAIHAAATRQRDRAKSKQMRRLCAKQRSRRSFDARHGITAPQPT